MCVETTGKEEGVVPFRVLELILSNASHCPKIPEIATYDNRQTSVKTSFANVISALLNHALLSTHFPFADKPEAMATEAICG